MNPEATTHFRYANINRKRVLVPLKMRSESKDVIPIDHNDNMEIEIIDPKKLTFSDLKRICEKAHIPLNEVSGFQQPPSLRELKLSDNKIDLKRALEAFLDSKSSSTESCYRKAFENLFINKIIPIACSLSEFIAFNHPKIIETIKYSSKLNDGKKRVCTTAYLSFVKYVIDQTNEKIDTGNIKKNSFDVVAENTPLTVEEWNIFLNTLRKINLRDALIAEVLNYSNGFLNIPYRTVSLKEVLALRVSWISDRELAFWRIRKTHQGVSLAFPKRILEGLRGLCCESTDLVFTTSKGNPIIETQMKRSFANASRKGGIGHITPAIVRLPIPNLRYCPYCDAECVCI